MAATTVGVFFNNPDFGDLEYLKPIIDQFEKKLDCNINLDFNANKVEIGFFLAFLSNTRWENIRADTFKKATDSCKQVILIMCHKGQAMQALVGNPSTDMSLKKAKPWLSPVEVCQVLFFGTPLTLVDDALHLNDKAVTIISKHLQDQFKCGKSWKSIRY